MAWPPPVLPINRTDALNQQTTHPADHNAANQAVNDIVGYVQSGLGGQLDALAISSRINGVTNYKGGLLVIGQKLGITTNPSSSAAVPFDFPSGVGFNATPVVFLQIQRGDGAYANFTLQVNTADANGFTFVMFGAGGAGVPNYYVDFAYLAVGYRN